VPSSESRWISFRATSSPVWRLRPLNTWGELGCLPFNIAHGERHRGIGALSQLLQLLKGAGIPPVVHDGDCWDGLTTTEVADTDGGVGAICDSESTGVSGSENRRRRTRGISLVPEDSTGGGELAGDL
jgi:hypothetical protein